MIQKQPLARTAVLAPLLFVLSSGLQQLSAASTHGVNLK
jgi:hypothetical protein